LVSEQLSLLQSIQYLALFNDLSAMVSPFLMNGFFLFDAKYITKYWSSHVLRREKRAEQFRLLQLPGQPTLDNELSEKDKRMASPDCSALVKVQGFAVGVGLDVITVELVGVLMMVLVDVGSGIGCGLGNGQGSTSLDSSLSVITKV
jgi:hypothetical protein